MKRALFILLALAGSLCAADHTESDSNLWLKYVGDHPIGKGAEERNKIAAALMQESDVAVNDLYTVVLPVMAEVGRENDVHFAPEGYALLAKAVAQSIETALPAKP